MSTLQSGIDLFNAGEFWHAHEAWEEIWLAESGDEKRFVQGLIQLAAAYHHVSRATFRGAVRLFDAALRKLEPFPPGHAGIDRSEAVRAAALHRESAARGEGIAAGDYPKLRYNRGLSQSIGNLT